MERDETAFRGASWSGAKENPMPRCSATGSSGFCSVLSGAAPVPKTSLSWGFPARSPLSEPSPKAYAAMLAEISRRTAELMAHWMSVGFVHGVLNTDNMSILGLTIDYGPYGFLDDYSPSWTPNITDASGRRYRYENQPAIGLWNLTRFAGALHPLVGDIEALEDALRVYGNTLVTAEKRRTARKLALRELRDDELGPNGDVRIPDKTLVSDLYELLGAVETDMTIFFRRLANVTTEASASLSGDRALVEPLREAFYDPASVSADHERRLAVWLERYAARVREDGTPDAERRRAMNAENPKYLLRNYIAQLAIERAEAGDTALISVLLDVLRRPFDEQPENERFAEKRPDWARHKPGCSMLSCSS